MSADRARHRTLLRVWGMYALVIGGGFGLSAHLVTPPGTYDVLRVTTLVVFAAAVAWGLFLLVRPASPAIRPFSTVVGGCALLTLAGWVVVSVLWFSDRVPEFDYVALQVNMLPGLTLPLLAWRVGRSLDAVESHA